MNYRHAFHAGNFADVFKHALLAALLTALRRRPGPLYVLDTHAGAGMYDLGASDAQRSGEWRGGIGRLDLHSEMPAALEPYRAAILAAGGADRPPRRYPGSPWIALHLLGPQDRLMACEAQSDAARALAAALGADPRVQIRAGADGWRALRTFLPPRERRGLVLIDPPFERAEEHARLGRALAAAHRQWPAGTLAGWYPIKRSAPVDALFAAAPPGTTAFELLIRGDDPQERLHGCGLALLNAPPGFAETAAGILDDLAPRLAAGPGAGWRPAPSDRRDGSAGTAPLSSPPIAGAPPTSGAPTTPTAKAREHERKTGRRPQAHDRNPRPGLSRKA